MDVLEELEATVAVGRLEHGDLRVVTVQADCRVGPLPTDRVTTEEGEPRSVKNAIAASRSSTAMPTFSSLMGMSCRRPSRDDIIGPRAHALPSARTVPLL